MPNHIAPCEATMFKNAAGLDVLRFSWQAEAPRSFSVGCAFLLSRTDPSIDGWKTLPVDAMDLKGLEVLQPKQVPHDILEGHCLQFMR